MMCCLMAYLLKVLSDMLQSPQPLSHIHICPKPKVKLGPTETFHPAPPSSPDIATATNPSHFGLTDGILVSPRWACKLSGTDRSSRLDRNVMKGNREFAIPSR